MSVRQKQLVGNIIKGAIEAGGLSGETSVTSEGKDPMTASALAAALTASPTTASGSADDADADAAAAASPTTATHTASHAADDATALSCIDIVSLTDLVTFYMRGPAKVAGNLAFQQRLCPYLIESTLCPLMSEDSSGCCWFECVLGLIFLRGSSSAACHRWMLACEWCLLVTSSALCFVRNVASSYIVRQGQIGSGRLATFRPYGCMAWGEVPLLFTEMKPVHELEPAAADQCVVPMPLGVCMPHDSASCCLWYRDD